MTTTMRTPTWQAKLGAMLALTAILFTSFGFGLPVAASSLPNDDPYGGRILPYIETGNPEDLLKFCHSNRPSDKFSRVRVSVRTFFERSHDEHSSDVIPPFLYYNDLGDVEAFPGINWNDSGLSVWESDCELPYDPNPILGCTDDTATNYKPDATTDDGSCEYIGSAATGTLQVVKIINGTTTATASDFSFKIDDGTATAFEADGQNDLVLAVGNYSVTEVAASGFTPTYNNCTDVALSEGGTTTCTITNTVVTTPDPDPTAPSCSLSANPNPVLEDSEFTLTWSATNSISAELNGTSVNLTDTATRSISTNTTFTLDIVGNDSATSSCSVLVTVSPDAGSGPTYQVEGYVWEDANENDIWDGNDDEVSDEETQTDPESPMAGWTVTASNGTQTLSTTTDQNGYYYFNVPAGTWTISETLKDEYEQTFPNDNGSHQVVVPAATAGAQSTSFFAAVYDFLIPTAHAQAAPVFGPFNFGVVFVGPSTPTGGGGGGGSPTPRCLLFEGDVNGEDIQLEWETRDGRDLKIERNGVEIFDTSISSEVDDGTFATTFSGATVFELTVWRTTRSDTCSFEIGDSAGAGAGGDSATPTPLILGEQVTAVPYGGAGAGAGGASGTALPLSFSLILLLGSLFMLRGTRVHG